MLMLILISVNVSQLLTIFNNFIPLASANFVEMTWNF